MHPTVKLFGRFILRDLRRNLLRATLTVFGIALGVAVMLAISLANNTALTKFKETVDLVSGKANLEIHSTSAPFLDEKCLTDLQWLSLTGAKYSPLIEDDIIFGDKAGTIVQLIGIDMLADPEFKTYGEEADGVKSHVDLLAPDVALVGSRLASDENLKPGSKFSILVNEQPYKLKVAGVLPARGVGGAFSGNIIVTDIATAQRALNIPGKVSRIEIIAPESDLPNLQKKLSNDLPKSIAADRPAQRSSQVDKMTASFQCNLLALTFIALMVSMFLIHNTMTISVIRRRPQIGTLRALGTSKMQILQLFALESLIFGLAGTGLGIAGGILFAQAALNGVSQTFEHFYFKTPLSQVYLNPYLIALTFVIGVGATMLAALAPAMEATSIAPAEATRRASYEIQASKNTTKYAVTAMILLVLAGLSSLLPAINGMPIFGYLSSLLTICGASLLMPLILKLSLPPLANLAQSLFGAEGKIAARSLEGTLGRTSVAIASLMIGIAMMASLAIMIGSFRQTVTVWVNQSLKADLWVQTSARAQGSRLARMSEATVDKLRTTPGVVGVDGFVEHPIVLHGEPTNIAGADLDVVSKYGSLVFTSGQSAKDAFANFGKFDAIVTEAFAIRKNVRTGDVIHIDTDQGNVALRVRGIYYDYASDLGYIVIPRRTYAELFHDNSYSNCAVYLQPNIDPETCRHQILRALGHSALLKIRTTRELRAEVLRVFDRTFAITYALHTIAVLVALLSVMNALFALELESKREFGILRYIGASQRQLRRIVLVEAGILAAVGNTTGICLGFVLSMLLIYVVNRQSFGWTVQLSVPIEFLAESVLLVFVTAIVSGMIPAYMAARTLAPNVVRDE